MLILVHDVSPSGGRRLAVRGAILGIASDTGLLEFLRQAGLPDADLLLDDPAWVKWKGGGAHEYQAV